MGIIISLALLALVGYMAYAGSRRGTVLIGLELATFAVATAVALVVYQPVGEALRALAGITLAFANVTAFIAVWIIVEIASALLVRHFVLPKLHRHIHLSLGSQVGGGILNSLKAIILLAVGLILFAGLPLSAATKQPVTEAPVSALILHSTGRLQGWLGVGLGRDLGDSLNFFTVTSSPESEELIELGYTTTDVMPSPEAEAAMLVLVNRERTSRGLRALKLNPDARPVARAYSRKMFARGYFSHLSPEGESPFDRLDAANVTYNTAGENLALAPTLQLAHEGLMNSPGHRANILSRNYSTVGIGIMDGGPYGLMITQNFTD